MTPQEINEAVSSKLGWDNLMQDSKNGNKRTSADYCHSIEVAWEIVWYLKNHGITIRKSDPSTKWYCSIFDWGKTNQPNDEVEAEADTAPMAICLAFLKLA